MTRPARLLGSAFQTLKLLLLVAAISILVWRYQQIRDAYDFVVVLAAGYVTLWLAVAAFSGRPARETLLNSALFTGSIATVFWLFEIPAFLGLVDYRQVFQTPIMAPHRNPAYRIDPQLLYTRKPHTRMNGTAPMGQISYLFDVPDSTPHPFDLRYDANGFRNDEDYAQSEVVVLGDSFVEGVQVAADELITHHLASAIGADVANLAMIGYGPRQQRVLLEDYAFPLDPQTIIWAFYEGNDLGNIRTYDGIMADPDEAFASFHSIFARGFTPNALLSFKRLIGDPRPSALPRSGWVDHQGEQRRTYFLYGGIPLEPEDEESLQIFEQIFRKSATLCQERGVRLVFVMIPTKLRAYEGAIRFDPGSEADGWRLNDQPKRIRAIVERTSPTIPYIDLAAAMKERIAAGEHPYLFDDGHWSPAGHRIAAKAILEVLAAQTSDEAP